MLVVTISFFSALNTEVAEQFFSILDRITTPVSFMGVENATRYVRLFMAMQDRLRRQYWNCEGLRTTSAQRSRIRTARVALASLLAAL